MLVLPSANIFVWAVALCAQSTCHSFGALFACRFIMGMCEGVVTPGYMIITSMFYTREEQMRRTGYWCEHRGLNDHASISDNYAIKLVLMVWPSSSWVL